MDLTTRINLLKMVNNIRYCYPKQLCHSLLNESGDGSLTQWGDTDLYPPFFMPIIYVFIVLPNVGENVSSLKSKKYLRISIS